MKLQGSLSSDFQFDGTYAHVRSGLNLMVYRAYSPSLARWINRDPIEAEVNDYVFVDNSPYLFVDPLGLFMEGVMPLQGPLPKPPGAPVNYPLPRFVPIERPKREKDPDPNPEHKKTRKPSGDKGHRKPPPPRPGRKRDKRHNPCDPPKHDSMEAIRQEIDTYLDCWWWCVHNCPKDKVKCCQDKCADPEWEYPRPDPD